MIKQKSIFGIWFQKEGKFIDLIEICSQLLQFKYLSLLIFIFFLIFLLPFIILRRLG